MSPAGSMEITMVSRQFRPGIGGLEDAVFNLSRTLAARGHSIRVVTLDRLFRGDGRRLAARETMEGIEVVRLPWAGSERYPFAPGVLRHLGSADVVHVHGIDFFFDFLALARLGHGRPLVATTHGGFFHSGFARPAKVVWFHTVTRLSARAYRRIICCGVGDGETFSAIAPSRLQVIENGVDTAKFRNAAAPQAERVLMYFGRLSANKNTPQLMPLLAALRKRHPGWRLIVAGRNWDTTFADLEGLVRNYDLTDAVTLVPEPDDRQLRNLMGRATYFISPSLYEGFGLTTVESLSAGLVPVLSDIPAFRRFVRFADPSLLFDPADPTASAAAIEALHASVQERYPALRAGLVTSAEQFAWKAVADRHEAIYRTVAKAGQWQEDECGGESHG